MKLSARQTIERPVALVFDALSDAEAHIGRAVARGAVVRRMTAPPLRVGSAWQLWFEFRGKAREADLEVTEFAPPRTLAVSLRSRNYRGELRLELKALTHARTQVLVGIDMRPKTLFGGLMIRSARLVKGALTRRLRDSLARQLRKLEARHPDLR